MRRLGISAKPSALFIDKGRASKSQQETAQIEKPDGEWLLANSLTMRIKKYKNVCYPMM
jgi:hypothetical protein